MFSAWQTALLSPRVLPAQDSHHFPFILCSVLLSTEMLCGPEHQDARELLVFLPKARVMLQAPPLAGDKKKKSHFFHHLFGIQRQATEPVGPATDHSLKVKGL